MTFFNGQYGTNPGQLGHYWKEVSYNKINLTGSSAYGWFTLPQPRSFYVTTVDGKEEANLDQLFKDCAAAADPTVNFNAVQGINMMFNGDWTAMHGAAAPAASSKASTSASATPGIRHGRSATWRRWRMRWATVTACRIRTTPMATTTPTTIHGT